MPATAIMTTTLPTVAGFGVLAETTRVMFDKRGKRIKGKSKSKSKGKTVKIYRGSRGGEYILRKGRKIYL